MTDTEKRTALKLAINILQDENYPSMIRTVAIPVLEKELTNMENEEYNKSRYCECVMPYTDECGVFCNRCKRPC